MADVLIRDVPEAVLAGVDAHASRLGRGNLDRHGVHSLTAYVAGV